MNEFNAHLESLSEHHDIPKVTANSLLEIIFPQGLCHLGWTWIITFTYIWCYVVFLGCGWLWSFISPLQTSFHIAHLLRWLQDMKRQATRYSNFLYALCNMGTFAIVTYLFHIPLENKLYESNTFIYSQHQASSFPLLTILPHSHCRVAAAFPMASFLKPDKKSHVCPPSTAIHPADRWETLFVYSFICKFTNLRHKVEGLESPMECVTCLLRLPCRWMLDLTVFLPCSLEEALMLKEPNTILTQLLVQFIVNLKPQTRNLRYSRV